MFSQNILFYFFYFFHFRVTRILVHFIRMNLQTFDHSLIATKPLLFRACMQVVVFYEHKMITKTRWYSFLNCAVSYACGIIFPSAASLKAGRVKPWKKFSSERLVQSSPWLNHAIQADSEKSGEWRCWEGGVTGCRLTLHDRCPLEEEEGEGGCSQDPGCPFTKTCMEKSWLEGSGVTPSKKAFKCFSLLNTTAGESMTLSRTLCACEITFPFPFVTQLLSRTFPGLPSC